MSETRWLDAEAAARYLCIRTDAFLRRVASGIIPPGSRGLGERTPLWWSADLDAVVRGGADRDSTNTNEMARAYVERLEASQGRPRRQAHAR
jgi:hypothetical protein